jgi:predicted ferric reductase
MIAPLVVALVPPTPVGRDFWTELSVACGFIGLSTMCLQFVVSARFRHVAAPYGIDVVLQFHRQIAVAGAALVLAHPVILFIAEPSRLRLLDPFSAPWRARAGLLGLLALVTLTGLAMLRRRIHLRYEPWRVSHGALALIAVAASLIHVELVGHYLAAPWKRGLWIGYTACVVALLLHVRLVRPALQRQRPYTVTEVVREAGRAWTLRLTPKGHPGLRFLPGQFVWLTLDRTPFAVEQHPFSLSSSALDPAHPWLTIKELGDFTSRVGEVEPGTTAYLEGPYGAFSIDRYEGPGFVFIAGGIGITPIMSMLRSLADRHDDRHHELVYAAARRDDLTFREQIARLAEALDLDVVYVLTDPPDDWTGERGRITAGLLHRHVVDDWPQHEYFVCGPAPMMDDVERALLDGGVPLGQIHRERFAFA